ncbi:MAG: phosphoglycerate kinase [bacterium]|nr:phosphoglycerate kinase [bacterium]
MNPKSLKDIDCKNKRVVLRVAYDVPLVAKGRGFVVGDDTRIRATLSTIKHLLKNKCKIVIVTWLGRPGGVVVDKCKLDPVAKCLSALLKRPVKKLDDSAGPVIRDTIERMKPKDIILLENVRFRKEEEKGDMKYGQLLASYGDLVVFDAFPQAHRDVPSTTGLLAQAKEVAVGFDMQEEVARLGALLKKPKHPFVVVLGGAKISDKIETFRHLLSIADIFLIGGAMAHNFLKARGAKMSQSLVEDQPVGTKGERIKILEVAEEILDSTKDVFFNLGPGLNVPKLVLPIDLVAASKIDAKAETRVIGVNNSDSAPWNWTFLDIGPATVEYYAQILSHAKTVFWNGPMGYVELEKFAVGTRGVAEAITKSSAESILGGGDTEAIVRQFKLSKKITYVSTGGGASLEFLAGNEFPVMKYLQV